MVALRGLEPPRERENKERGAEERSQGRDSQPELSSQLGSWIPERPREQQRGTCSSKGGSEGRMCSRSRREVRGRLGGEERPGPRTKPKSLLEKSPQGRRQARRLLPASDGTPPTASRALCEENGSALPQKIKHRTSLSSSNSTSPQRTESRDPDPCTPHSYPQHHSREPKGGNKPSVR